MAYICKVTDTGGSTGEITTALYGTCTTNADVVAKVVTCASFDKLLVGVTIRVRFDKTNTATNPTLNVNSTGAKAIRVTNESTPKVPLNNTTASWYAGETVEFIYLEDSSTGYWYMTNSHAVFTTQSINNPTVTAKSPSKISAPASGTKWTQITAWTTNTPTVVNLGDEVTANAITYSGKTASKATAASDISASLIVTEDISFDGVGTISTESATAVTSSKLDGTGYVKSGTISEGVLTLAAGTATDTTSSKIGSTGAATVVTAVGKSSKTVKSVKTNTSKTIKQWTFADVSCSQITAKTDITFTPVESVTAGVAASLSKTDYTLTYAAESCSLVSTSAITVVKPR